MSGLIVIMFRDEGLGDGGQRTERGYRMQRQRSRARYHKDRVGGGSHGNYHRGGGQLVMRVRLKQFCDPFYLDRVGDTSVPDNRSPAENGRCLVRSDVSNPHDSCS